MTREWLFAALGLVVACESSSEELSAVSDTGLRPLDARVSAPDVGFPPGDAGAMTDAGTLPLCPAASTLFRINTGRIEDGFEGIMRFEPIGRIQLVDETGMRRLEFDGSVPESLLTEPAYYARVEVRQPFWSEARVTFWYLDAMGAPGDLAFIGWMGPTYGTGRNGSVIYRYESQGCGLNFGCGLQEGLRLVLRVNGEENRLNIGDRLPDVGYEIMNGVSARYLEPPECTDTPDRWTVGWVFIDRPSGPPCASLQRDACIADTRCVLWGSELRDPAYVCRNTSGACEPIVDPGVCQRAGGCVWDSGECYCPEGEACICGGGPAPKCRSSCGGFAGLICPDDRYCEETMQRPPQCDQVRDGSGRCEWVPNTCEGTPTSVVCACFRDSLLSFDNDCLRRQAFASRTGPCVR